MGLDSVELVMEIEDRFDLSFSDEEASRIRTAGDLYDFLVRAKFAGRPMDCLTRGMFYRVRRALALDGKVPARARPAHLLPDFNRRRLEKLLVLRIPRPRSSTLGGFVREVLNYNYGLLSDSAGVWHPAEVWGVLRQLVSDQLGVSLNRVTRHASLVDDLGMN